MKKLRYFLFLLGFIMATSVFAQQKKVTLALENVTVKAALEALKTERPQEYSAIKQAAKDWPFFRFLMILEMKLRWKN